MYLLVGQLLKTTPLSDKIVDNLSIRCPAVVGQSSSNHLSVVRQLPQNPKTGTCLWNATITCSYSIKRKTTILNPIYSETWLTVAMPQRRNKKTIFAAYARFSRISRVKDSRRNRWHVRNGQIVDSIRAILAVITKLIWLTQKPSPLNAPSKRSKASCK